jgi:hypothetical protein
VKVYKFLAAGAVGSQSGFRWPVGEAGPGAWVEVQGPLALCLRGVHVCRDLDLAHWLNEELWEAEIAGETADGIDCLVARRGRLVRRIEAWQAGGNTRFGEACLAHASALCRAASPDVRGFIDDAAMALAHGYLAVCAFATATAVARLHHAAGDEKAFRDERLWQSGWIARALL